MRVWILERFVSCGILSFVYRYQLSQIKWVREELAQITSYHFFWIKRRKISVNKSSLTHYSSLSIQSNLYDNRFDFKNYSFNSDRVKLSQIHSVKPLNSVLYPFLKSFFHYHIHRLSSSFVFQIQNSSFFNHSILWYILH